MAIEKNDIYIKVLNKVKETVDKLNKHYNFSMDYPNIHYDIIGTNGGLAKSASMSVHYNDKLLKQNEEDFIETTVPHEVCHIAVYHKSNIEKKPYPKNGHGADWKLMMWIAGVPARKYHQYEVERKSPIEYKYKCGCANGVIVNQKTHKKIKDQTMLCKKCNKVIGDWERIMKIGFIDASPNGTTKIRVD
jgi:SprT protein